MKEGYEFSVNPEVQRSTISFDGDLRIAFGSLLSPMYNQCSIMVIVSDSFS